MRAANLVLSARRNYHGWMVVGVLFMASAVAVGSSNYAFGLFIAPLETAFGWQRTAISASLSFMAVSSMTSPIIGRMMDRYGARPIMTVSLTIYGLSYLLRPAMTELWHWYALSFLQFVAFSGVSNLPAGRLVGVWFQKRRGRVMGITMMGNNFGGLTMPIVAGAALAASWEAAFLVFAAIAFFVAFLALVIIRDPHDDTRLDAAPFPGGHRAAQARLGGRTVREALHSKSFYVMTLAIVMASFTYSAVLPQVSAHLANEGMSAATVPLAVSLLAIGGMMGKLLFGYLAERFTARQAMKLSLGGQIFFISLMVGLPTSPLIWAVVPLFGLNMGGYGTLVALIVQENFGLRYFGSISGLVQMATVLPFALGPLMAGASFDLTDGYGPGFIAVSGLFAIGILSLTQMGQPISPRRGVRIEA